MIPSGKNSKEENLIRQALEMITNPFFDDLKSTKAHSWPRCTKSFAAIIVPGLCNKEVILCSKSGAGNLGPARFFNAVSVWLGRSRASINFFVTKIEKSKTDSK